MAKLAATVAVKIVLLLFCMMLGIVIGADRLTQPEQIHINYGDDASKMIVTWSTFNDTASAVLYGLSSNNFTMLQQGSSYKFIDGGSEQRVQFIHTVELTGLTSNTTYYYVVGSGDGWSSVFYFTSMPAGENWDPSLVVIGDLGSANAQSLPRLQLDAAAGMYDAIIHVGDFAYDLQADNARVGDTFMKQIESLAATLPYMTCPGNHEYYYNFSNYKARFNMPNDNKRMYYSFNMGPIHFVSISTEFLYFPYFGYNQIFDHYDWLKKDLTEANLPENRAKRPWIVTFGHRPMYCSNNDNDDCTSHESLVRVGVPMLNIPGLEPLFYEQGVDVAIWAHEHSYERLWPVYKMKVENGSYDEPYTNPSGITHIITGSAGCSERVEYFEKNPPEWSAFRSSDYGYTRMKFFNTTHLYVEQVSDDKGGQIIDSFTLIKDQHGPYSTLKKMH
ncbi:hypothetical protein BsWGS_10399 [Bradybaena similaris]